MQCTQRNLKHSPSDIINSDVGGRGKYYGIISLPRILLLPRKQASSSSRHLSAIASDVHSIGFFFPRHHHQLVVLLLALSSHLPGTLIRIQSLTWVFVVQKKFIALLLEIQQFEKFNLEETGKELREKSFCSRKKLKALLIRVSQFISGVKLCEEEEDDDDEENPKGFQRKEGEHLHTICLSLAKWRS